LKAVIDLIAANITELFDRSVTAGQFDAEVKETIITPAIRKPGLDTICVRLFATLGQNDRDRRLPSSAKTHLTSDVAKQNNKK